MMRALIFLLLILPLLAHATEWVVKGDCNGGCGTTDGTSLANAWDGTADVVQGGAGVVAGDTLCFTGVFRTTLTWTQDGTPSSPIRLSMACPGMPPADFRGGDVITAWTQSGNEWISDSALFVTPYAVIRNGSALHHGTEGSLTADEWAFQGSTTNNVVLGFNPSGYTVEVGVRSGAILVDGADYVNVVGDGGVYFTGYRVGSVAPNSPVQYRNAVGGLVWQIGCYISRGCVDVRAASSGVVVMENSATLSAAPFDCNWDSTSYPSNLVFIRNFGSSTWIDPQSTVSWLAGVTATHGVVDEETFGCTRAGSNITWLHNEGQYGRVNLLITTNSNVASGLVSSGNFWHDSNDDCVQVSDNGASDSSFDFTTRADIFLRCGRQENTGAYAVAGGATAPVSTAVLNVYNATIVDSAAGVTVGANINLRGFNNLIANPTRTNAANPGYYWFLANMTGTATLDNNAYYGGAVPRWRGPGASITSSFTTWKTQVSGDANALNAVDPQFVGGTSPNTEEGFRLKAASQLCGAGAYIGKAYDKTGRKLTPPYPIGAYKCNGGRTSAANRAVAATRVSR